MALVKCPECGRDRVSDQANACPGCGYNLKEHFYANNKNVSTDNPGFVTSRVPNSSSLSKKRPHKIRAWVVIGTVALILFGIWFFSTRCHHKGCFRTVESGDIFCSYHRSLLDNFSGYSSYNSSYNSYDKPKDTSSLKISDVDVYTNSAATYCTGTIKNEGLSTYKFVKVKGSFKDASGNIVETGDSYAAGDEGLAPGESTTFRISASKNRKVESCDVKVYDYDTD